MPVSEDELDHGYTGTSHIQLHAGNMSKAEQRRSNKPVMEKRRRARINHCLNELKSLILDAMNKDPARHSKLEKADILEMTVKHLQTIQRQQLSLAVSADPGVVHKFRSGFSECVGEVSRYMGVESGGGVEAGVRQRLVAHLTSCVQQLAPPPAPTSHTQLGVTREDVNNNTAARQHTLQLIPSRLPTGELALLLPNSQHLPLFPDNQVSTTSDSTVGVAVSSSRSSAFTAVTRDRSPPPSPSSTTTSDSPITLPSEVSSTSDRHNLLPQFPSAIQTPLTVITNSEEFKERQHFLEIRSQQTDVKDPLDFSIKKGSYSQPYSPPIQLKRPFREDSFDSHPPLKISLLSPESQIIPQPERRSVFETQNRIPNVFVEYRSLPGLYPEPGRNNKNMDHQASTSESGSSSRDMWRPW